MLGVEEHGLLAPLAAVMERDATVGLHRRVLGVTHRVFILVLLLGHELPGVRALHTVDESVVSLTRDEFRLEGQALRWDALGKGKPRGSGTELGNLACPAILKLVSVLLLATIPGGHPSAMGGRVSVE